MDIVDGLRLVAGAPTDRLDCFNCHSRMREAADEITRLRAELERSRDELADSEASMLRRFDPAAADSTDLFTWITCLRAELDACKRDVEIVRFLRCGGWEVLQNPKYWTLENKFYGAIAEAMAEVAAEGDKNGDA